ncbi:MAG: HisA/HisF-related TIM barrel protein [Campylobacterota bacterium]|nr:HisA/HisF-related TIM barrel protein [Campylobacterota bacterium]
MLKQRIIATLIVKNGIVVQSIGFKKYLPIGKLSIAVDYLNKWGIDEIIILDIDASKNSTVINSSLIHEVSSLCFVPLCVGGGISNVTHIKELLQNGADKVSINHHFLHNPSFIHEAVSVFGSQCIIISLDIKKIDDVYRVYDVINDKTLDTLEVYLKKAHEYNVGEILLNSVDRDGMKTGLDTQLITFATEHSKLPIIVLGGASNPLDLLEAIKNPNLSGVSAANFFHYFEHSVNISKSFIKKEVNYPIRNDNYASYNEFEFTIEGKIKKRSDLTFAKLLFEVHKEEKI